MEPSNTPGRPADEGHAGKAASEPMSELSTAVSRRSGLRRYIGPKRAVAVVAVALMAYGAWYLRKAGFVDPADVIDMVKAHPVAMTFGFVLLFAVAITTALPTLPLNLVAGVLWGPILGGFLSTAGATIGATIAFLVARSVVGQVLARRFDNRFVAAVQRELEFRGWRFLAFVRLNPIFPTGPLNYILGLTALPLWTYVWSTFAFLLVPSWVIALVGHEVGTFVAEGEVQDIIRVILIISGAIGVLVGIKYVAVLLRGASAPK